MAKSTYLQFCKTLQRECGVSGTSISSVTNLSGALLNIAEYIKLADAEVQARWFNWDFLHVGTWSEPTVVGNADVAAPADIGTWDADSFYLDYTTANWTKLTELDYRAWRARYRQGVKVNGTPSSVVIMPDRSLKLESPPDAIYTLSADYWKRPEKMTANDSTSVIPEEFERIIIARAKISYAEYYAAGEIMAAAQVEFDDLLDKLESQYLPDQQIRRLISSGSVTVQVQ